MADMVVYRDAQILGHNETEGKNGTYRTVYIFVPGAEKGYDGQPQVEQISVEDDASFAKLKKMVGKSESIVCEKQVYRSGGSRITFLGTAAEFFGAAKAAS